MASLRTPLLILLALASLGLPGCGLKRRHACTATASYAGRTVSGRGTDFDDVNKARDHARADLCTDYCQDQDPTVEAALRAAGKATSDPALRPTAVNNPPVQAVYNACLTACKAATASVPIEYKCETQGFL